MSKPLCILPCAGYGTRVGMAPDRSKELNEHEGRPLIGYSMEVINDHGLDCLVITRKEKTDLIAWCESRKVDVQVLDKPGEEWAATVLKSRPYWRQHNLLLLPDTIFDNREVVAEMMRDLELGCDLSFGVHEVEDQSKWSTINSYCVTEKPDLKGKGVAWGCVAFTAEAGVALFNALRTKNEPFALKDASFHSLKNFRDVTRGSTIGI